MFIKQQTYHTKICIIIDIRVYYVIYIYVFIFQQHLPQNCFFFQTYYICGNISRVFGGITANKQFTDVVLRE